MNLLPTPLWCNYIIELMQQHDYSIAYDPDKISYQIILTSKLHQRIFKARPIPYNDWKHMNISYSFTLAYWLNNYA